GGGREGGDGLVGQRDLGRVSRHDRRLAFEVGGRRPPEAVGGLDARDGRGRAAIENGGAQGAGSASHVEPRESGRSGEPGEENGRPFPAPAPDVAFVRVPLLPAVGSGCHGVRYTSVFTYLRPESTMRVTRRARGPSRSAT